jgi:hypothetical protein
VDGGRYGGSVGAEEEGISFRALIKSLWVSLSTSCWPQGSCATLRWRWQDSWPLLLRVRRRGYCGGGVPGLSRVHWWPHSSKLWPYYGQRMKFKTLKTSAKKTYFVSGLS